MCFPLYAQLVYTLPSHLPVNASLGIESLSLGPEFVGNDIANFLNIGETFLESVHSCSLCMR